MYKKPPHGKLHKSVKNRLVQAYSLSWSGLCVLALRKHLLQAIFIHALSVAAYRINQSLLTYLNSTDALSTV